jgi:hypothetical protein
MNEYLIGTTTGHVLFIEAEDKEHAWNKARSLGWYSDELRYHGFLNPHLDAFDDRDSYSTV